MRMPVKFLGWKLSDGSSKGCSDEDGLVFWAIDTGRELFPLKAWREPSSPEEDVWRFRRNEVEFLTLDTPFDTPLEDFL